MKSISDVAIAKKLVDTAHSAKDRNIEFDISFKRMKQLMTQKTCFYSGETLVDDPSSPLHRTIERVDNSVGYLNHNVVAASKKYNSIKNNHPDKIFINLVNGIKKHQKRIQKIKKAA